MTPSVFFLLVLLPGNLDDPLAASQGAGRLENPKPPSRSYTQIDRDISAFLRNEALAKSDFSRAAAIRDLGA